MTIYCRCLSGKKRRKKIRQSWKKNYLNLHASVFICCLISYQHDIDSTVDLAEAVIVRTRRQRVAWKKKKHREKEEKQSVVGWFVFVSSLCRVSVCSVDWGSSWVQVQITWRRIGPAFTLPAPCSTLKASKHSSDSRPPVLNSPPDPHPDPPTPNQRVRRPVVNLCEVLACTRFSPLSWFLPVTSVRFSAVAQQQQQQQQERAKTFFFF